MRFSFPQSLDPKIHIFIISNKTFWYHCSNQPEFFDIVWKCSNLVDTGLLRDYIDFDSTKYNNIKTHFSPNAAKLWYFILVNDVIKYRIEIRSKGDWDNSPQMFIHNI